MPVISASRRVASPDRPGDGEQIIEAPTHAGIDRVYPADVLHDGLFCLAFINQFRWVLRNADDLVGRIHSDLHNRFQLRLRRKCRWRRKPLCAVPGGQTRLSRVVKTLMKASARW